MMTATRLDAFRQVIERTGLIPPSSIPMGKLTRFPGVGKSNGNKSGWAWLSEDGLGGAFGDWASGLSETWAAHHDQVMTTAAERAAHAKRVAELRRIRQEEEARQHAEVAQQAQAIWDHAAPAPADHPYLLRKSIRPHSLRLDAEARLLVPVMIDGSITSLQTIDDAGEKRFLLGGKKASGSFTLGNLSEANTILICEGYATGASLYETSSFPVVVAFDAGNLRPIAEGLRQQYPTATILVCGDNDVHADGKPNTGLLAATAAASAIDGILVMPELNGQKCDWNDVHVQCGLDAVREKVSAAIQREEATTMESGDIQDEAPATVSRAIFRRVADVQAKPIRWLWPGRIAQGKVSIIAGNPGLGKSQVTVGMAATVSTGGLWPVDRKSCEVGNVVILSAEDDPSDTIRPRLEASGADLSRVYILDAVLDGPLVGGGETPRAFNLKTDIAQLGNMLKEIGGAALVIIDPITAYLGTTDSHKNAEIRALLSPLAEVAGQYGAAVVAVSHFNKNANTEAMMRVTGSLAFVAAARAAYVVARDPEHEARRLLLPLKNNLGNDQTGLAFTVESAQVESSIGMIETSRVVWESSVVTVTADEAMKPQAHDDERDDLDDAKDFLCGLLAEGPVPSKQIRGDAEGAGHAWRTIQRAQKVLGIVAVKKGMKEGWVWQLDTPLRPEDCHEPTKNAVPDGWQPSYSSGGLGGLQGGDTVPVEVEI